jgi:hypothetical protein
LESFGPDSGKMALMQAVDRKKVRQMRRAPKKEDAMLTLKAMLPRGSKVKTLPMRAYAGDPAGWAIPNW